jgi:hypothetical protein
MCQSSIQASLERDLDNAPFRVTPARQSSYVLATFHHFGKVLEPISLDLQTNSAQQYLYERQSKQHFAHVPACAVRNTPI